MRSLLAALASLALAAAAASAQEGARTSTDGRDHDRTTASDDAGREGSDNGAIPADASVDAIVWGAVVYASRRAPDKADPAAPGSQQMEPAELPDLAARLAKIEQFRDYKHFELVGQHTQKLFSQYPNWVVPSKELFLNVDSRGPAEAGGMNLHVQLWRRAKVLVKSDTTLKKGSPLIIGGPEWREGRLIFVLTLKE